MVVPKRAREYLVQTVIHDDDISIQNTLCVAKRDKQVCSRACLESRLPQSLW